MNSYTNEEQRELELLLSKGLMTIEVYSMLTIAEERMTELLPACGVSDLMKERVLETLTKVRRIANAPSLPCSNENLMPLISECNQMTSEFKEHLQETKTAKQHMYVISELMEKALMHLLTVHWLETKGDEPLPECITEDFLETVKRAE
jgi:hypothetical protein